MTFGPPNRRFAESAAHMVVGLRLRGHASFDDGRMQVGPGADLHTESIGGDDAFTPGERSVMENVTA